jgi:2-polyprenyl-3-methyl-5-hydroxy-6-metoxy-1,4-benzoquinol methylase
MSLLPYILDRVTEANVEYGEKLRAYVDNMDSVFHERAEAFVGRYDRFIVSTGRSLDFGIDCFVKLRKSMVEENLHFMRTGEYSSKSFAEVNQRVYSNPETMQYHMHGLVFAQFLWPDQYRRFSFFSENLPSYAPGIRRYLEIGSGHGLYLVEAVRILGSEAAFEAIDISPSSMELAQGIASGAPCQFRLMDIFDLPEDTKYDFITIGEVLEHLEQPRDLLLKLHALLMPEGHAYITTPANAPTRDHIYLFHNAAEIRAMLTSTGLVIEREVTQYASDLPQKRAEKLKVPLMFAAFVKKA